jgi:hypothetical protein
MAHRKNTRIDKQNIATDTQSKKQIEIELPPSRLPTAQETDQPITIRFKQFLKVTGLARSTAFEMWNSRSRLYDAKMPVGFKFFESPNAPRFFFYDEVVAWLMYRAELSRSKGATKKGVLEA